MLFRVAAALVISAGLTAAFGAGKSRASELRVAATIAPVHALVSMVTEGMITPDLIIQPGASPHSYALKPSEARALNDADVVFWVGEGLEPWMAKAITTLAGDAEVVELGALDGIEPLAFRAGGVWAGHGHEPEAEHAHDHDHEHDGATDPHLWLDPDNALVWLGAIAEALAGRDPDHAEAYRQKAEAAEARIGATVARIEQRLQPIQHKPYIVFHDAYQYFEHRFGLHPVGAVSLSDADRPGPARLLDIRQAIVESGAVCVFSEPQFDSKLIDTVIEGSEVKRGMLDPIGAGLEPGADLYPKLILDLAENLLDCLG